MKYVKAFVSGSFLPFFIVPIILLIAWYGGKRELLQIPFLHLIPLLWGVWNVLYFAGGRDYIYGDENTKLLITGGVLGLLIALIGVFFLKIPPLLGAKGITQYFPLVFAPMMYALLWRYGVKSLNKLLQVE